MSYTYVSAFTGHIITFATSAALAWSSPVLPQLRDPDATPFDEALTTEQTSWISALLPIGALFGPFIHAFLADRIGRKNTLLICALPCLTAFLILAFAKSVILYYVSRFMCGLSVGGALTVVPMYIAEIAEDSNRGALGSSIGCFICGGLLFSYSVGPYASLMVLNITLAIFPAAFLVLFFWLAPESPHYYVSKQQHDLARSSLEKLRGPGRDKLDKELIYIQNKIKDEQGHASFLEIFKSKGLRRALLISMGLLGFKQLSGIDAVLFYSQSIFEQSGTSLEPAICSIIIGIVQFISSFATPLVVDRLGRKFLLIFSAVGLVLAETSLGVYGYLKDRDYDLSSILFLPLLCLIVYVVVFSVGIGPLPWAILGELFPSNYKSIASSSSAAFSWFIAFLVTKYFSTVSDAIGMGPSFWIFATFCAISIPFSLFYVIETKGKSLQDIQNILNS